MRIALHKALMIALYAIIDEELVGFCGPPGALSAAVLIVNDEIL
jgi:hypothetical protein